MCKSCNLCNNKLYTTLKYNPNICDKLFAKYLCNEFEKLDDHSYNNVSYELTDNINVTENKIKNEEDNISLLNNVSICEELLSIFYLNNNERIIIQCFDDNIAEYKLVSFFMSMIIAAHNLKTTDDKRKFKFIEESTNNIVYLLQKLDNIDKFNVIDQLFYDRLNVNKLTVGFINILVKEQLYKHLINIFQRLSIVEEIIEILVSRAKLNNNLTDTVLTLCSIINTNLFSNAVGFLNFTDISVKFFSNKQNKSSVIYEYVLFLIKAIISKADLEKESEVIMDFIINTLKNTVNFDSCICLLDVLSYMYIQRRDRAVDIEKIYLNMNLKCNICILNVNYFYSIISIKVLKLKLLDIDEKYYNTIFNLNDSKIIAELNTIKTVQYRIIMPNSKLEQTIVSIYKITKFTLLDYIIDTIDDDVTDEVLLLFVSNLFSNISDIQIMQKQLSNDFDFDAEQQNEIFQLYVKIAEQQVSKTNKEDKLCNLELSLLLAYYLINHKKFTYINRRIRNIGVSSSCNYSTFKLISYILSFFSLFITFSNQYASLGLTKTICDIASKYKANNKIKSPTIKNEKDSLYCTFCFYSSIISTYVNAKSFDYTLCLSILVNAIALLEQESLLLIQVSLILLINYCGENKEYANYVLKHHFLKIQNLLDCQNDVIISYTFELLNNLIANCDVSNYFETFDTNINYYNYIIPAISTNDEKVCNSSCAIILELSKSSKHLVNLLDTKLTLNNKEESFVEILAYGMERCYTKNWQSAYEYFISLINVLLCYFFNQNTIGTENLHSLINVIEHVEKKGIPIKLGLSLNKSLSTIEKNEILKNIKNKEIETKLLKYL